MGSDHLMSLSGMVEIPRLQATQKFVMPAEAGIQEDPGGNKSVKSWIPACAGMTERRGKSTYMEPPRLGAEGYSVGDK